MKTIFLSAFIKPCPHCESVINMRALRKVPRVHALRWYQFTRAAHTACPQCRGFVTFTIGNSPWWLAFPLLLAGIGASALWCPAMTTFLSSLLGRVILLATAGMVAWFAVKHSALLRESPP